MIEIIEQEIKWSKKHGGESGKSEAFEVGYVAGLKQALYLLNAAAEQLHEADGACAHQWQAHQYNQALSFCRVCKASRPTRLC